MLSIIQAAGWPIWPLILCSVIALTLIIERLYHLRTVLVAPPTLVDEVIGVTRTSLPAVDVVALDRALEQLRAVDEGMYQTAELHFFCGMTIVETSEARGISTRTVNREITKARALLAQWLDVAEPA